MQKIYICIFAVIILIVGGFCVSYTQIPPIQAFYENENLGIGFPIPKGYQQNPYAVEENVADTGTIVHFLEPESRAEVFSSYHIDKDDWDNEIKEIFPVMYNRDDKNVLLCIPVSDVQYDVHDAKQQEKYTTLWE